jgi:hypothetical protein
MKKVQDKQYDPLKEFNQRIRAEKSIKEHIKMKQMVDL